MTKKPDPSWIVLQWTKDRPFWSTVAQGNEGDMTALYRNLLPNFAEKEKVGLRLYNTEGRISRWAGDHEIAKPGAET